MPRKAKLHRKTNETDITVELNLDGSGSNYTHETGVGFFDHMLDHVARHGRFDLKIKADGDYHIDDHHTVEDVGITLGQALDKALGDKKGIERYGFASAPMDESLARVSVDLAGRAALVFAVDFPSKKIGTFETQLVREFLGALTANAKFACHVEVPHGANDHHIAEAVFKALGRALRQAVSITGKDVPSTKGSL
jgi:imidazoleglycerol-phosphate dehydratase